MSAKAAATKAAATPQTRHDQLAGDTASNEGGASTMPATFFVLDMTAIPGKGTRIHEMVVEGRIRTFKFEPTEALELPVAIAIKFLKHKEFRRTDAHGNLLAYRRQPKQPDELGAGEAFKLEDHQSIADYCELTTVALLQRALELPGGEMLPDKTDRQALIDFLIKSKVKRRAANVERTRAKAAQTEVARDRDGDLGDGEFLPEPE